MTYKVEIFFKRYKPTFGATVNANCSEQAKALAIQDAKQFGFCYDIKKVTAKAV